MTIRFFIFCLPFLCFTLYAYELPFFTENIDETLESFRQGQIEESSFELMGGVIFLTQNVGFRPHKPVYSPGYRIILERDSFFKTLDLNVAYTFWEMESKKVYKIPILLKTRTIQNQTTLNNVEVLVGHNFNLTKTLIIRPLFGVEWAWKKNTTILNEKLKVHNDHQYYGPLTGLLLKKGLGSYFSLSSNISFSYLKEHSQRTVVRTVSVENESFCPKFRTSLGIEGIIPIEKNGRCIRLGGSYEVEYLWENGVNKELEWVAPLSLQGFFTRISFNF